MKFGTVTATILADSATQTVVTAPAASAGTVDVVVTTPAGSSATGSADHYSFVTTPAVTGVSPATGPIAGGTSVTISGSNLANASSVSFGTAAATITSDTAGQIVATAPAGSAGTVDITVSVPGGGTSPLTSADHYTYAAQPSISAVSPNAGPTAAGTSVTSSGSNLANASSVKFGTTAATITSDTAGQIVATAPGGTAGSTVDITVTTPGGTSSTGSSDRYSYDGVPSVSSLSTGLGSTAGGTSVTISGSNLSGATAVTFGTMGATITSNSGGQVVATSPTNAAGSVYVYVTTPGGTSSSNLFDSFYYIGAAPTVSSITPGAGAVSGGTRVTITGTSLASATSVKFGSVAASIVSDTPGQIVATAPAGTAGTVDITVSTSSGTSPTSSADRFTYTAAPTVTALGTTSGSTAGGASVTISGTNLSGATGVSFGTLAATITSDTATQIIATSPGAAAGTIDVVATTAGGSSATSSADQFTYTQAVPVVSSASPTSGPMAGGTTVTITGTSLASASSVKFGSTTASIVSDSPSQIVATAPAGAPGSVDITVATPGGTSATGSGDRFSYLAPAPSVTGLSPAVGSTSGGVSVTITGTNLGYATAVHFGAGAATITSDTANQIVATAPAGSGTVDVTVTTPGGTTPTGPQDLFSYVGLPALSSVSPSSGATTGGSIVVINGTNLGWATTVKFGTAPASILSDVANQIVASSPAGAAGTDDIVVTTPAGSSSIGASDQFSYLAASSTLQVVTSPSLASTVSVDGVPRDNGAVSIPVAAGGHQVCFGPVAGHSPPPCQLVVTSAGSPTTVTGTFDATTTYSYNGDGIRTSLSNSGVTTQETWDSSGSLPLLLAENNGGAAVDFIYGPGGTPLEQIEPTGAPYFLYQDAQGSTIGVVDGNGNVVAASSYDPYGNVTATVGSFPTPLGYDGQVTDAESGMVYLRSRYFDPVSGQFLSVDPMVASTRAPFDYGNDNPLNRADPSGLMVWGQTGASVMTPGNSSGPINVRSPAICSPGGIIVPSGFIRSLPPGNDPNLTDNGLKITVSGIVGGAANAACLLGEKAACVFGQVLAGSFTSSATGSNPAVAVLSQAIGLASSYTCTALVEAASDGAATAAMPLVSLGCGAVGGVIGAAANSLGNWIVSKL